MPNIRSRFSRNPISFFAAVSATAVASGIAAFVLAAAFPTVSWAAETAPVFGAAPSTSSKVYEVAEVLTGDTFRLTTGTVVAYSSIVAPPLAHPDLKVREYGKQALEFNRALLLGKRIRVEFGSRIKNAEGIYQGFIFLEDGTFANLKMVEAGFAKLSIVPPNLQYAEELRRAAQHARHDGQGLWEHENQLDRKFIFVGDQMTHKFHFEGCASLDGISKAHLERFDSSVAAKAAGYTFCKTCRHSYAQQTDLF